jgi:hypothetical protein
VERTTQASASWAPRVGPRELVLLAYELGVSRATGVLTIEPRGAFPELVLVRVGEAITSDADPMGRQASARLARLATLETARLSFHPGAVSGPERAVPLARWARQWLERDLDLDASNRLACTLQERDLALDPARAPDPAQLDPAERRLVAALARPRTLGELATVARVPRYRLLAFLHFLSLTDGLRVVPSAPRSGVRRAAPPRAGRPRGGASTLRVAS